MKHNWIIIIVLKPGSARQVDPGLESGRVEKKIGKEKIWCDPVTQSKTR
jgi:hypothetical protein